MDYSQLSDDQLRQMVAAKRAAAAAPTPSKPYDQMTDDELRQAVAAKRAGASQAPAMPTSDNVIEEMHPDFTTADRLLVKNFSNDGDSAARYLQKQHPNLEVKAQGDKILARGKGETAYKVLDPDTGFFSGDFLRDVGDVAYDIGSGIGSSAATAAGGMAGALPGAAAAGAGASAGLEALRQGIGRALGVNDEMKGGDIGLSAATGAVSPLLFGTGASTKAIADKAANQLAASGRTFLTEEAAKKALKATTDKVAKTQQGAIGRAYDWGTRTAFPWVGEKLSGANRQTIRNLPKYLPQFDKLDEMGRVEFNEQARNQLNDALEGTQKKTWEAFEDQLRKSGNTVDVGDEIGQLQQLVANAKSDAAALGNEGAIREADALEKTIGNALSSEKKIVKPKIDVAEATNNLVSDIGDKLRLEKHAEWAKYQKAIDGSEIPVDMSPAITRINDKIAEAEADFARRPTKPAEARLNGLKQVRDDIFLTSKAPKNADGVMGMDGLLHYPQDEYNPIAKAADALRVKRQLSGIAGMSSVPSHGNNIGNRFSTGFSQVDKELAELARMASDDVDSALMKNVPPEAKDRFAKISRLETSLKSKFNNPEAAERTLRGLDPEKKAVLYDQLKQMDDEFGTNVVSTAEAIRNAGGEDVIRDPISRKLSPQAALKLQRQMEELARRNKAINPEDKVGQTAQLIANQLEGKVLGALGGTADENLSSYKYAKGLKDIVMPHFKDAERANRTLGNLGGKGKQVLLERMQEIDSQFGTNMEDKARLLEAANVFAKPSLDPISANGTTSTSRTIPAATGLGGLGYWLGANLIPGQGGAGIGAALGVGLGSMIGAPSTVKAAVKAGTMTEAAARKLLNNKYIAPTRLPQSAPASVWNAVMDRKRQEADGK